MIAWLVIRFCTSIAAGRTTSRTSAMASSCGHESCNTACGVRLDTIVTTRPTKTGIVVSSSATTRPAANSATTKPAGLARMMPIERAEPGRRRAGRKRRGFEQIFEKPEHAHGLARNAKLLKRTVWSRPKAGAKLPNP